MFNIVDLVIILVAILQGIRWAKQGFIKGVFPLLGFWIGILVGARAVPHLIDLVQEPFERLMLTMIVIVISALIVSGIGELIANKISKFTDQTKFKPVDSVFGAVFSMGITLFLAWILAGLIVSAPFTEPNRQIRDSAILQALDTRLPPVPETLSRIGNLIDHDGFPQVFTGLEPRPVEPVELPSEPQLRAAIEMAGLSTVRLESPGCGGIVNGSGFVAAPDIIVTNAHVVAGIENPVVVDANGSRHTTPIYFDPNEDIAILRADNLAGPALGMANEIVPRGTKAVVLGYPGGGPLEASASGILRQLEATGRDIYGERLATRSIYELQTFIRSGNSGGPVVDTNGNVIALVFARSTTNESIGYGIVSTRVQAALDASRQTTQAVNTGRCVR